MAIFTITNGESSELAVTKVTPIIEDCFTIYEYLVTTNNGDSITIDLSGNHYEAKYFNNTGSEISFSDTATVTYNNYLKVRFLLLNSGVSGVFPNATITITNNTLSKYYENYVERENDNSNCYDNTEYVLRTGDTMEGTLNMGTNTLRTDSYMNFYDTTHPSNVMKIQNFQTQDFFFIPSGGASTVAGIMGFDFLTNKWNINGSEIITFSTLSGYLPLAGGTMSGNINMNNNDIVNTGVLQLYNPTANSTQLDVQLNDVLAIRSGTTNITLAQSLDKITFNSGTIQLSNSTFTGGGNQNLIVDNSGNIGVGLGTGLTVDTAITNGSTNPVENNAIYDALQLKSGLTSFNTFTNANVFTSSVSLNGDVSSDKGINFLPQSGFSSYSGHGKIGFMETSNDSFYIKNPNSSSYTLFDNSTTTAVRTLIVPNQSGTIALLSDIAAAGGGDMLKSIYDTGDNGIVDNSELLQGNNSAYHLSRGNHTGTQLANTISDFDTEVSNNASVVANTAKVSNATHTGDVTGSTVLTIANNAVTTAKIADNNVTTAKLSNSGVIAGSYTNANITVDAKGRITTASNGSTGSGGITQTDGATTLTYNFSGTAVSSSSSGTITANWVKTGKQVTLRTTTPNLSLSTKSAGASGVLTVNLTNLPFTSTYQIPVQASLTSTISGVTMTPITLRVSGTTISGDINFYYNSSFAASGRSIYLSVTYITT